MKWQAQRVRRRCATQWCACIHPAVLCAGRRQEGTQGVAGHVQVGGRSGAAPCGAWGGTAATVRWYAQCKAQRCAVWRGGACETRGRRACAVHACGRWGSGRGKWYSGRRCVRARQGKAGIEMRQNPRHRPQQRRENVNNIQLAAVVRDNTGCNETTACCARRGKNLVQ